MLSILEILLDFLIQNKDKKIEASALNEMLEKCRGELEKEQDDEIKTKNSYLRATCKFN